MSDDVAVVGSSLAGVHAARALRTAGHEDRIVVFGDEPHAPYDRPPLSKEILQGTWAVERSALRAHQHDDGIEWRPGTRVDSFDTASLTLTLADGSRESYPGGVVIATGAAPRRFADAPTGGVHVLRSLDDAVALAADLDARPEHVVVVGGGFIGGEVASSARHRGLDVTMVEMTAVPFARALGDEVGSALAALHRAHGVEIVSGVAVSELTGSDHVEGVALGGGRVLPADVVVLGLGVEPNTGWLDGSGLTVDNGVVCDRTLLAAPRVVAAGDVARWPDRHGELHRLEHWDNAIRQGRHVAKRLRAEHTGDAPTPYDEVPWMWSDQYDVKLQVYGDTRAHDEVRVVDGSIEEGRFVALYRRGNELAAAVAMNRNREVSRYRAMLAEVTPWAEALRAVEVPT